MLGRAKPYAHKPQEVIISCPWRQLRHPWLGPILTSHWSWDPEDYPGAKGKGAKGGLGWRAWGPEKPYF